MTSISEPMQPSTIDDAEIKRFNTMAASWWDADGPMKALHSMNPLRLQFIRDQAIQRFGLDTNKTKWLKGKRVLDVGCGAGLVSEPLARLGGEVDAIDAASENIAMARVHASLAGLSISYQHKAIEQLVEERPQYDLITALEIIEHVNEPQFFINNLAQVLKPGGLLVLSTLNRTAKAFGLAIVGAEYLARLVPRGTHDWRKFVKPSELSHFARRAGLVPLAIQGMGYNPLTGTWFLEAKPQVNYLMAFTKV